MKLPYASDKSRGTPRREHRVGSIVWVAYGLEGPGDEAEVEGPTGQWSVVI